MCVCLFQSVVLSSSVVPFDHVKCSERVGLKVAGPSVCILVDDRRGFVVAAGNPSPHIADLPIMYLTSHLC